MRRLLVMLCRKLGLIHPSGQIEISCPRSCVEVKFVKEGSSFDWGAVGGVLDPGTAWNNAQNWTYAGPNVEVVEVPWTSVEAPKPPDAEEPPKDLPPDGAQPQDQP